MIEDPSNVTKLLLLFHYSLLSAYGYVEVWPKAVLWGLIYKLRFWWG